MKLYKLQVTYRESEEDNCSIHCSFEQARSALINDFFSGKEDEAKKYKKFDSDIEKGIINTTETNAFIIEFDLDLSSEMILVPQKEYDSLVNDSKLLLALKKKTNYCGEDYARQITTWLNKSGK